MARIAIIGPGAIGSVMAAWLENAGHDVLLCSRRPMGAIAVETPSGELQVRASCVTDPTQASPVDWVLVATKAYQAEGAAKWFGALCADGAPVAVLQNGVEHLERFSPYLPEGRIVPVIVDCPAERGEQDKVRQRGRAKLTVQEGDLGTKFATLFAGTQVQLSVVADFNSAAWRKLCQNSPGILNALLLEPAGAFRDEKVAAAALQIVRECAEVARAEGAVLAADLPEEIVRICQASPPDSINSLHADRIAGRPMEIEARNGAIVRLGRKHRIATPANQLAVALLERLGCARGGFQGPIKTP